MKIREYIEYLKKTAKTQSYNINWRGALDKKGYPSVLLGYQGHLEWQDVHAWCEQQFGKDSYTWTGSRFWFDRTEDAALFALRWA